MSDLTLAAAVLVPVAAGLALWTAGPRGAGRPGRSQAAGRPPARDRPGASGRLVLGAGAVAALAITLAAALVAAWGQSELTVRWGAGLDLRLVVAPIARAPVVLVPAVALPVAAYAAAGEDRLGLRRLVGLLVAFVGAMELLLLAGDLVTLLVGWELVGAVSWGLIAHEWRGDAPAAAAHAFTVTRLGDLGLFVAAGAAFAATGSLDLARLGSLPGGWRHAFVAGVVLAAAAKSAQLPFSPWLFSAMAGPTSASALLHAATMVAAGAYLLARLQPVLAGVAWFAPSVAAIGVVTALSGGVVAALQRDAKRLLAASTSAHYGLMLVAVAAGYPAVAVAHLVAHGLFKALLFLAAGVAITASGSHELPAMRLGRALPWAAGLAAVGSLALAGVPPLGGAWTKEQIVAAGAHLAPALGVMVVAAGGLSAYYAGRFQLLAFGPPAPRAPRRPGRRSGPGAGSYGALAWLAAASAGLTVLWLPPGREAVARITGASLPDGATWEVTLSLLAVALGLYAAFDAHRPGRALVPRRGPLADGAADWLGLPALARRALVDPALAAARAAASFDDRVVDAVPRSAARLGRQAARLAAAGDDGVVDAVPRGVARLSGRAAAGSASGAEVGVDAAVRGLAGLVGDAARDVRRLQGGRSHQYYLLVAVGVAVLVAATALWR